MLLQISSTFYQKGVFCFFFSSKGRGLGGKIGMGVMGVMMDFFNFRGVCVWGGKT